MIIVDDALVDDEIATATFCCDVAVCKGACCTLPGRRGAPLEDGEVAQIQEAYPAIKGLLPEASVRTIESGGLVEGTPGDFATRCVDDNECVFAYFENGAARCSFEHAFLEGKISWQKPLSCHLFPIRVRHLGRDFIRYEQIEECRAGRTRGEDEQIRLYDFLKTPLARKYGQQWFASLRERVAPEPPGPPTC